MNPKKKTDGATLKETSASTTVKVFRNGRFVPHKEIVEFIELEDKKSDTIWQITIINTCFSKTDWNNI